VRLGIQRICGWERLWGVPLPKESASTARSGVGPINCINSAKATPTTLPRNSKGMGGKQLSKGSGPSECQTKGEDCGVTSRAKPTRGEAAATGVAP